MIQNLTCCALFHFQDSCQWTTQVLSRQGKDQESQIVLKRPRHEDRLTPCSSSMSIPSSIQPRLQGIDIIPAIRGVQDHMSTWMSSLIHAQGGCLQMVAQRVSMGRAQQEQLAQQVAQRSTMPSMSNQFSYLRAQLASFRSRRGSSNPYASTQQ